MGWKGCNDRRRRHLLGQLRLARPAFRNPPPRVAFLSLSGWRRRPCLESGCAAAALGLGASSPLPAGGGTSRGAPLSGRAPLAGSQTLSQRRRYC